MSLMFGAFFTLLGLFLRQVAQSKPGWSWQFSWFLVAWLSIYVGAYLILSIFMPAVFTPIFR